ncbi:MAG: glycosyltransferase, partial [Actinobacteria bacterium]|nr:glycosyltransferase [Actinomycetota bacterium]
EPVAKLLAHVDDERLQVVRVEHGGTSRARNAGFAVSRGDWIRFVDCDDVLEAEGTAHLLAVAGEGDVIAYGATIWCDEELRPTWKMSSDLRGWVVAECLLNRFPVMLQALLFPRRIVERAGEWDSEITVCQDWDFLLRALELAPVRGDDRTVSRYRRHAGAASAGLPHSESSHRLGAEGMHLVIERYFDRHPEQRGTKLERAALAQVELVMAWSHREAYLTHLGRAVREDKGGVLRELRLLSRLVASKAARSLIRPVSPREEA